MEGMIRILIADDHAVICQGLAFTLEKNCDMRVVANCTNGIDALNWLCKNECDVAIVDIAMPGMNGIDLLKQLRKEAPKLPVLIFSSHPEDQFALRLIKAGAAGYLSKDCASDEIAEAVRSVVGGKKHISPAVVVMLANELSMPDGKLPHEVLSNREYHVFLLIASGKKLTEIADILKLNVKTIGTYRSRIMEKMHLHNNAELMRYAIEHKLTLQTS